MKLMAHRFNLLGLVAILTSGCAPQTALLPEAVGPAPEIPHGVLMVYSSTFDLGNLGPTAYSGYRIYSSDGAVFENVQENGLVGVVNDEPRKVTLPRGKYVVEAEAEDFGRVKVPVVIEDGRVTVVCLRRTACQDLPPGDRDSLVTLPNGDVVGWHATGASANNGSDTLQN